MTDTSWLTDNWPWWIALFTLLAYEVWAIYTQWAHRHWPETAARPSFLITLSRMYWRAHDKYPLLDPLMLSVLAWLVPHFLIGDVASEWVWTLILWIVIWVWHIKRQGATHA